MMVLLCSAKLGFVLQLVLGHSGALSRASGEGSGPGKSNNHGV